MELEKLIFDWNSFKQEYSKQNCVIEIYDETLRDGLQTIGIEQPTIENKLEIIKGMSDLELDEVCIGFPAAGENIQKDIEECTRFIVDNKLQIKISCCARTMTKDIEPIISLSQKYGIAIDAIIFIGLSPIRQYVEGWNLDHILNCIKSSIEYGYKNKLSMCLVTEDTTRSRPEEIKKVYETAIEYGANRICLCDTVGYSTPEGTSELLKYTRGFVDKINKNIPIDWHGHNDRGLALANSLAAINAGANRIHACGLGLGERAGNTAMEELLINLKLQGIRNCDLLKLKKYCKIISDAVKYKCPQNKPFIGEKVFSTSSGIHTSAIIKAYNDKRDLSDLVYSCISANELGEEQTIRFGPMSGKTNIQYLLNKLNYNTKANEDLIDKILLEIKQKNKDISETEMMKLLQKYINE